MKNPFKIELPDCDDDVKSIRTFWHAILGGLWVLLIMFSGSVSFFFWGLCLAPLIGFIAHYVALIQVKIREQNNEKRQQLKIEREQLAFEGKMDAMERENQKQDALSKAAQSKQELIIRLGSIDQYVRVLSIEMDVSKRTVALQAAHSEMTTLAAKLASGQISREAVAAPDVREHASETSNDLARLGLTEDRLNRDIKRMFKLGAN
jgi:hypothetical protein